MLVKVRADADSRAEIMQIVEVFRAKIVDVGKDELWWRSRAPGRSWKRSSA